MIKKLFSAAILLAGFSFATKAETHTYAANPIDSFSNGGEIALYNYITNTSADPADSFKIDWKVISIDNPSFWTITNFCDNNSCYVYSDAINPTGHTSGTVFVGNTAITGQLTLDVIVPQGGSSSHLTLKIRVVNSKSGAVDTVTYRINPPSTTAINTIKNNDARVTLSPNPASSSLVVFADKSLHASQILISNIVGQSVYTSAITNEKTNVNVSTFAKGIYLVKIINDKGLVVTSRQFVKD